MVTGLVGVLGPASVAVMLFVMAFLSKKLGGVTQAKPYYLGFYAASFLIALSAGVRLARLFDASLLADVGLWGVIYNGLFATGVTIGLVVAWRYWSWLLAERN
jgi:hypothetical protein